MKKKTTLMVLSSIVALGTISVAAFSLNGGFLSSLSLGNNSIQPGTLLIDVNDPNVSMDGNGTALYKSAFGNDFEFYFRNVTKENGYYTVSNQSYTGVVSNNDPINGIYRIDIDSPFAQTLSYGHKLDNGSFYYYETVDLVEGLNTFSVPHSKPTKMLFSSGDDSFSFYSIKLYYSCTADVEFEQIFRVDTENVAGYNVNVVNTMLAQTGSSISDIDLTSYSFHTTSNDLYIDDASDVEELEIHYNNSDSSVVLAGTNKASISFIHGSTRYYSDEFNIEGYASYSTNIYSVGLEVSSIRKKETDALPTSFRGSVNGDLEVLDSNNDQLHYSSFYNTFDITDDMVTSYDENPFTRVGSHVMKIMYLGKERTINYTIYDPEYCNISHIQYTDLSVAYGITNEAFLTYITAQDAEVYYYEYDSSLPNTIRLSADCFQLTANMFNAGNPMVIIPITYGNYSGEIYIRLTLTKGNLVDTFTSEDTSGVNAYGYSITNIKLYDNGVADYNPDSDSNDYLTLYTYVDGILTIVIEGANFRLEVDSVNKTFVKYQPPGTLLYTFAVDFTALGAPSQDFVGKMYDNGLIAFELGETIECDYEFNPGDNTIIYFVFAFYGNCIGTIDYANLRMVVTPAA